MDKAKEMKIGVLAGTRVRGIEITLTDDGDDAEPRIQFNITKDEAKELVEQLQLALVFIREEEPEELEENWVIVREWDDCPKEYLLQVYLDGLRRWTRDLDYALPYNREQANHIVEELGSSGMGYTYSTELKQKI